MKHRILSTLGIVFIIIFILLIGGSATGIWLLTALALVSQHELHAILRKLDVQPMCLPGMAFGALLLLGTFYYNPYSVSSSEFLALIVVFFSIFLLQNFKQPSTLVMRILPTLFSIMYIPFMLSFYVWTLWLVKTSRGSDTSACFLVLWLIVVAKFTDIGGLLAGTLIGRHKLAPIISPAKTWEGAFGGVLVAAFIGATVASLFGKHFPESFTTIKAFLIAIPIAIVAIASDLVESRIKRFSSTKDSGSILPGIGGALDLTDSLILSAPLGYFLAKHYIYI